jgi:rhodanese-related sulfurtransferase
MKNLYPYIIASFVLIVGVSSYFLFRTPKCLGSECEIEIKTEKKYFEYKEMDPITLETKVSLGNVFLLDVRELSEWQEGYIKGASHLPLGQINKSTVKDLPKDKSIYVYCRSGRRAEEAVSILKTLGFEKVLNIGGVNHWLERGGELIK